jgi:hypothetical protein
MRKFSVVSAIVLAVLVTACNSSGQSVSDTSENTESTTAQNMDIYGGDATGAKPEIEINAVSITAYGQILNNACVYLNENCEDKITGDVKTRYDETCDRLHNINLIGIVAVSQMSDEEREDIFRQLEEIEVSLFDDIAAEIGVKAELTEAVTTTAAKSEGRISAEPETEDVSEEATEDTVEETTSELSERITAGK